MKCPYCGKELNEEEKKNHSCFRKEAEKDIKPLKWKPGIKE